MKKYDLSLAGLNECIADRHETKRKNLLIVGLISTLTLNVGLTLVGSIVTSVGMEKVIIDVIAFKPF